ncbi:hypothetical protein KJ765_00390 [Candidatus Micrarchaeota archaeon]|nr:hypothetical protein [Candidatus Micrarchaeota archaeon]
MVTKCDRCHKDAHFLEGCMTCQLNICRACQKSTKNAANHKRAVICKTCWGIIPKRKQWEQA